jgi:hypothetical protein
LAKLLHKETKLLQTIDRLKLGANKGNRVKRVKKNVRFNVCTKAMANE